LFFILATLLPKASQLDVIMMLFTQMMPWPNYKNLESQNIDSFKIFIANACGKTNSISDSRFRL